MKNIANMKKKFLFIITSIIVLSSFGQKDKNQFIGLNLLQLPSSTLNMNYSIENKPFLTSVADFGYAFGYNEKYDLIGIALTPNIKLLDGYLLDKQLGGYLKLGGFYNFRKGYYKHDFFHVGLFLTSSVVYESGFYLPPDDVIPNSYDDKVKHTVCLVGLSSSIGYEFEITKRLKTNIDFQLSFPSSNYLNLYSYSNFIPGMGFKDTESMWFPMLILNLKYKLDTDRHLREN
jgi:hypothetical protein